MWNYDEFKRGALVEILNSPATKRWGVTVKSPTCSFADIVYPPTRGIVVDIFIDDLMQKYAMIFFQCGTAGHVYVNSLKLIL